MAYQYIKIVHEDKETSVSTDITEMTETSTDEGVEARVDSFNFKINSNGLPVTLDVEDGIKIYFNGTLVMDGKITELTFQGTIDGYIYQVKGQNKLETLLNNVAPSAYNGRTASYIVGNMIDRINSYNTENYNGWTNIGKTITATTHTFDYYQPYKPIFQQIEEISTDEYTQNGAFVYYLDTDNNFVWKPRPSTVTSTLSEGVNGVSIKIQKGTWDTINALIIHAGDDDNGNAIHTYAYNLTSIGKVGWKWKYIAMTDIAKEYIKHNSSATTEEIRAFAKTEARRRGQIVCDKLGAPRFRVVWTMRGTASYVKGNLYTLEVPSYGWSGSDTKNLRLTDIKQSFTSKRGWLTDLHFEEDEDAALENL